MIKKPEAATNTNNANMTGQASMSTQASTSTHAQTPSHANPLQLPSEHGCGSGAVPAVGRLPKRSQPASSRNDGGGTVAEPRVLSPDARAHVDRRPCPPRDDVLLRHLAIAAAASPYHSLLRHRRAGTSEACTRERAASSPSSRWRARIDPFFRHKLSRDAVSPASTPMSHAPAVAGFSIGASAVSRASSAVSSCELEDCD